MNPRAWDAAGPLGVTKKDTAQNRVLVRGGTVRGLAEPLDRGNLLDLVPLDCCATLYCPRAIRQ